MLVVLFRDDEAVWKSLRNLGERVQIVLPHELNTYDVLVSDYVVFSRATLEAVTERFRSGAIVSPATEPSDLDAGDLS